MAVETSVIDASMFRVGGQETVTQVGRLVLDGRSAIERYSAKAASLIPLAYDALPAVLAAARTLPNLLSGPEIEFCDRPPCLTFKFYIGGYNPELDLGQRHLGQTGVETIVRYSVFPVGR
ncbi:hypothetical protein HYW41_00930 [Candidatus Daviesbacteria bacterium]|nr:hypothetical protein [Candidatus Daviesbacteria bacterium]